MAKYIECEAVLALIRPDDPSDERCAVTVATAKRLIRHALAAAPAADVAPVIHAQWIGSKYDPETGDYMEKCSHCGVFSREYWKPHCSECGAKMEGGDSNAVD